MQSLSAFVVPLYFDDLSHINYLGECLDSIIDQSDPNWIAVIVADGISQLGFTATEQLIRKYMDERLHLISTSSRFGPGIARNLGISRANELGAELIFFLDSDDISPPNRVSESKKIFNSTNSNLIVYSHFLPIDRQGKSLGNESIRGDMAEVLEYVRKYPFYGEHSLLDIFLVTGFIATTSTVSVHISTALSNPFPPFFVSEDFYTWTKMNTSGASYYYAKSLPVKYRFKDIGDGEGSPIERSARFLREKVIVDISAFCYAVTRNGSAQVDLGTIHLFLARLSQTVLVQNGKDIGATLKDISLAKSIQKECLEYFSLRTISNDQQIYSRVTDCLSRFL